MATFDPNRVGPGTFELVRDATTGNYSIKEVGFTKISPLNLPDLDTTAATTTATQTKTATDTTGDTLSQQTKMAFNMPDTGGDNQPMTTGSMLQQARQTSDMLSGTFADTRQRMTTDDAYKGVTSPLEIKDPTATVFGRPREGTIDQAAIDRQRNLGLDEPTVKTQTATDRVGKARIRGPQDLEQPSQTTPTNLVGGVDQIASDAMTRQEMISGATPDDPTANQLGVSKTALDMDRFAGVSQMGALAGDEKDDVKPVKKDALQTISTSLKTTGDSILNKIKTPTMMALEFIGKPRGESAGAVALNKNYFTDRGDGRIGGNPATDLYAGMNRVSAFGNLEKAGERRIARREQTIATKNVSQKFIDDTNRMKEQQANYKAAKKSAPVTGTTKPGESGGSGSTGGGKIVCTMMNKSYGFGSFRNKIWLRHSKNLAPEYQIGYHRIFLPLVKKAKTNKVLKKILEHIAIHRTIDIRQEEKNKIHLLGRIYRTILEPICYWVGKI
jgi:hypothetical protein